MKQFHISFLALLAAAASASAAEFGEIHGRYTFDVSSAYVSRGKVIENRPIQVNDIDVSFSLGDYGRVGFWHWDYSCLSGKYQDKYRRFMPECDWGVYYGYTWDFAAGYALDTEVMAEWMTYCGERGGDSPTSLEWRAKQSLKTPYATPFWKARYTVHPLDWGYYQVGIKRSFALAPGLKLTPSVSFDFGDSACRLKRFGPHPEGCSYGCGALSAVEELTAEYAFDKTFSVHATVARMDILDDDGRDARAHGYQRGITYAVLGASVKF